jgi:MSHA biogenesis protein MshP
MSRRQQRGMSLMVAIFLIAIIASLAAFAVTMGSAARNATNLQLLASRALAAAKAGAEWGAFRALNQGACPNNGHPPLHLNQGGLRGFRVNVRCVRSDHNDGVNFSVVDITATAQWSNYGAPDYAYRQVTVRYAP